LSVCLATVEAHAPAGSRAFRCAWVGPPNETLFRFGAGGRAEGLGSPGCSSVWGWNENKNKAGCCLCALLHLSSRSKVKVPKITVSVDPGGTKQTMTSRVHREEGEEYTTHTSHNRSGGEQQTTSLSLPHSHWRFRRRNCYAEFARSRVAEKSAVTRSLSLNVIFFYKKMYVRRDQSSVVASVAFPVTSFSDVSIKFHLRLFLLLFLSVSKTFDGRLFTVVCVRKKKWRESFACLKHGWRSCLFASRGYHVLPLRHTLAD
jgi:hypothetical protein